MTSVILGHIPFAVIGIFLFGLPDYAGKEFIFSSIILHFLYPIFLLNAYKFGDLSEIYPVARGLSPLIIIIVSFMFFREEISIYETIGILIISFSLMIYGLKSFFEHKSNFKGFGLAVITGFLIASYSIVDGYGARVTQNPIGFYSFVTIMSGIFFYFYASLKDKNIIKRVFLSEKKSFFIGGTASYLAYVIVVWACLYLPIAVVSSLRETSILFAVLLGLFFLKEKINLIKLILILGLLCGIIILRLN